MRRLVSFLIALTFFGILMISFDQIYHLRIQMAYYEQVGDIQNPDKFKSMVLKEEAVKKKDNLFLFGSSELNEDSNPYHPSRLFGNQNRGFQVNIIGDRGTQSIIHDLNIAAVGNRLKGQKVVYFLSPQWFGGNGIGKDAFLANFQEEMFYSTILDGTISNSIKQRLARRIHTIVSGPKPNNRIMWNEGLAGILKKAFIPDNLPNRNQKIERNQKPLNNNLKMGNGAPPDDNIGQNNLQYEDIAFVSNLYSKNDGVSSLQKIILTPYFQCKCFFLSLKDEFKSLQIIKTDSPKLKNAVRKKKVEIKWDQTFGEADKFGQKVANNNPYDFDNDVYNNFYKADLGQRKGEFKNLTYTNSPETEDFKLFLDLCKEKGIKPMIVNVPVNGKWYDYAQFEKGKREQYYQMIRSMVNSYGFEMADFSGYEYEKYFMRDAIHLGYRGWVYVDKELDRFYNENQSQVQ